MTREEAIRVLRNEEYENALDIPDSVYDDWGDAFAMAISALEQPEIVLCKDCVFGHLCFDVHNGIDADSWVECTNPDGLYRDVSCEGYCSAAIRRKGRET